MKQIGAFEAKNKLAELLDLAENGEEIIITRHGAVEDIKKMRKGMHIDDATIKELINEGRR